MTKEEIIIFDNEKNERLKAIVARYHKDYSKHILEECKDLYDYVIEKSKCLEVIENLAFITRLKFVLEKRQPSELQCKICRELLDLAYTKLCYKWPLYCSQECKKKDKKHACEEHFRKTGYRHWTQVPGKIEAYMQKHKKETGYCCSFQDPKVIAKCKQKYIDNCGCNNPAQNEDVQQKIKISTRRNKYEKMLNDELIAPLFTFEQFLLFDRELNQQLWWQCGRCGKVFAGVIAHGKDNYSKTFARCPYCFPKTGTQTSFQEIELANFCKMIIPNKWKVVNNENLNWNKYSCQYDILLMENDQVKLAIEYNGIYWHSTKQSQDPNKQLSKTIILEKKKVPLVHIYEDEWMDENRKNKIKIFLKNIICNIHINGLIIDFKSNNKQITLARDKFSLAFSIQNYDIFKIYPPQIIYRGKNKEFEVYDCGKIVYQRKNIKKSK